VILKIVVSLIVVGILLAILRFLFNLFYGWIAIEVEKLREEDSE
jgi:hypothetical protein